MKFMPVMKCTGTHTLARNQLIFSVPDILLYYFLWRKVIVTCCCTCT